LPFQLGSKAAPVFVYSQFLFPIFNLLVQPWISSFSLLQQTCN
jgi:hypothetical protein